MAYEDKVGLKILRNRDKAFSLLEMQIGKISFEVRKLNFESLLKIIINQQLSNKAADSIFNRLKNLLEVSEKIKPETILNTGSDQLRTIGVSYSKIGFMKDLADKMTKNPDLLKSWDKLDDEEALIEIQKLNGFGPWSANIILLFYMGRPDVFPFGDTTLKKAYLNIYGQHLSKDLKEIEWSRPYRSTLARYFWRWVDNGMRDLSDVGNQN